MHFSQVFIFTFFQSLGHEVCVVEGRHGEFMYI